MGSSRQGRGGFRDPGIWCSPKGEIPLGHTYTYSVCSTVVYSTVHFPQIQMGIIKISAWIVLASPTLSSSWSVSSWPGPSHYKSKVGKRHESGYTQCRAFS